MKQNSVQQRIDERNSKNSSVVTDPQFSHCTEIIDTPQNLPLCPTCNGKKLVQGLFTSYECSACCGLGVDVANPLPVISFLLSRVSSLEEELKQAKAQSITPEEREALAVEKFYSNSKHNKHD